LPAIKPDFMQGPASKAKKIKKQQQQQAEEAELSDFEALGNVDVTSSDSDEDWTPDMERRKRAKGEYKMSMFQLAWWRTFNF